MPRNPKSGSVAPVGPSNLVYQIKVTLKGVKPPIWRRVQVRSDITLKVLHRVLQLAMGWHDAHLHAFNIKGESYGDPEDEFGLDEKKFRLNRLNLEEKDKFIYEYDFGDDWVHEILLEKILPVDEKTQYPICLKGKRSCPLEDSGGPWGYMDLLDIISDPDHPDYEESIEWVPKDFDSEMFDADQINWRLKAIRR
jgi:hypothetical protein